MKQGQRKERRGDDETEKKKSDQKAQGKNMYKKKKDLCRTYGAIWHIVTQQFVPMFIVKRKERRKQDLGAPEPLGPQEQEILSSTRGPLFSYWRPLRNPLFAWGLLEFVRGVFSGTQPCFSLNLELQTF